MPDLLGKRHPPASEAGIGPSSCTSDWTIIIIRDLTVLHSEEAAVRRYGKDATTHHERGSRCFSASEIVLRIHQCAHGTPPSAFPSKSRHDLADVYLTGIKRCRRQARRPYHMASQVQGKWDVSQRRPQSRRDRETRTVRATSLVHCGLKPTDYVRSLKDIGERSSALSGKGKLDRMLDKKKDLEQIVKLVEELRQAILIYQVGTVENHQSS